MDPSTALQVDLTRTRARAELLRRDLDLMVESADTAADDEHDPEGTTAFERAQTRSLLAAATAMRAEIEDAQRRLAAGTYGSCESCARPIPAERLLARPTARRCVPCAARGRIR